MKLRLPRLLASALLAAVVSSSVYAEGTQSSTSSGITPPEGYKISFLDNPSYLNAYKDNDGNKYMLVLNNDEVSYNYDLSALTYYEPYISGGSLYVTSSPENSIDLRFKSGSAQAFYQLDELVFDKMKCLEFSSMSSGAIYSDGISSPAKLTISNTASDLDFGAFRGVSFECNYITDNSGGAICAVNTYVNIHNNLQVVFFSNSSLLSATQDEGTGFGDGEFGVFDFIFDIVGGFGDILGGLGDILGGVGDIVGGFGNGTQAPEIMANGGAINLNDSSLTIEGNKKVNFSSNQAAHYGGAIYAGDSVYLGREQGLDITVNINNNGEILFSGNEALGTAIKTDVGIKLYDGKGGAIYMESGGQLSMNNNMGIIKFTDNKALLHGGAVHLDGRGFMECIGNTESIIFYYNEAGDSGGAIFGDERSHIKMIGNTGDIIFEKNKAGSNGGAICTYDSVAMRDPDKKSFRNSIVQLADNEGTIIFRQNSAGYTDDEGEYLRGFGGAIYCNDLYINNNKSVLFERNVEIIGPDSYLLRSLYLKSDVAFTVSLSAAKDGSIQFNDSIYISGNNCKFVLNDDYTPAGAQESIRQEGDIIFSGATTEKDLEMVLQDWTFLKKPDNVDISRTSTVGCLTEVAGGRLRVEDSAIFKSHGIKLRENSGATLLIKDAQVVNLEDYVEGNFNGTSISVGKGTALEVHGMSTIQGGEIAFADGAEWRFGLSNRNFYNNAALSFDGMMSMDGGLTLILDVSDSNMNEHYCLYKGSMDAYDNIKEQWTAGNIKVNGIHDAAGAGFDDLVWRDGGLYYVSSMVWGNNEGTWLWNLNKDKNWQNERVFNHGMNVKFTDTAAGEVTLVGKLVPAQVTVVNSEGNDYTFVGQKDADGEAGRLSEDTNLVKRGTGTLTLNLANDYYGVTRLEEGTLNLHDDKALGDSTLTTAKGTTLGVGDGSHVVLEKEGYNVAGNVVIDDGATLEIKGNYGLGYAAANTAVEGTLRFTNTHSIAGTLTGKGKVEVENSHVRFNGENATGYFRGDISVSGEEASFTSANNIATTGNIDLLKGNLISKNDNEKHSVYIYANGSLNMVSGDAPIEHATVVASFVTIDKGAVLSASLYEDSLSSTLANNQDAAQNATHIFNSALGGVIEAGSLTLTYGSTLVLDQSHINLSGGYLIFDVYKSEQINLVLTLDGVVREDSKVLLFSGVNSLVFDHFSNVEKYADTYSFFAKDYFTGSLIGENTKVVFNSNDGTVTLVGLVPEPTTATLSLLALAALATRRRRK